MDNPSACWLSNGDLVSRQRWGMCVRAFVLASLGSLAYGASPQTDAGAQLFNNACRTCHSTREGDNRFGPSLYNIIGRKAGSLSNYSYSSAMKDADFVWDETKLNQFIAHPDAVVPENTMSPYGGVASADERAKIIAYLRSMASGRP